MTDFTLSVSAQHVSSIVNDSIAGSMASNSIKLLTGNSHPELAKLVAKRYVVATAAWGAFEMLQMQYAVVTTGAVANRDSQIGH
jgi:hypothetical protein